MSPMPESAPLEDFRTIGRRVSNWGRWGADDERGTLNLITPDRVVEAARLVRTGKTFALGIPFDGDGPQDGRVRGNPMRTMKETAGQMPSHPGAFRFADDYVFMALQAASQWDSLAHVHYDGLLNSGFPSYERGRHGRRALLGDESEPGSRRARRPPRRGPPARRGLVGTGDGHLAGGA